MKLQLVGIGALLGMEEDYCFVKEIVPGGPADLGQTAQAERQDHRRSRKAMPNRSRSSA